MLQSLSILHGMDGLNAESQNDTMKYFHLLNVKRSKVNVTRVKRARKESMTSVACEERLLPCRSPQTGGFIRGLLSRDVVVLIVLTYSCRL